jgi:broad specificity phosphatase PhoE
VLKCQSGWSQSPLTEKGRAEALLLREKLKDIHFDHYYSSDLRRAKETQEVAFPEVDVVESWLLREINTGRLQGVRTAESREKYGEFYIKCRDERNYIPFNGENKALVRARAREFLKWMEELEGNVAVFSHRNWINCLIEDMTGIEWVEGGLLDNGKMSIIEFSDGEWKILGLNV